MPFVQTRKAFSRHVWLICFAVVYVSCSPVHRYQHLDQVKDWEDEIQAFEALDKTEQHPDNAILFTGSSSIRLWNTLKEDMAPYPVIQRGYGGARFSDFAVYSKRIIYPHQFQALVIFLANDITGGENDKTPEEVRRLFDYVVECVRDRYAEQPIFFIEITPTPSRWKAWHKISALNKTIKDYCQTRRNVYFIDTAHAFLNKSGAPDPGLFRDDMLHLNESGYRVWRGIIKAKLDDVLS